MYGMLASVELFFTTIPGIDEVFSDKRRKRVNLDNLPGGKLDNIHTEITRPRNRNVNAPWTFYVDMTYDNLCQFMSKHHGML